MSVPGNWSSPGSSPRLGRLGTRVFITLWLVFLLLFVIGTGGVVRDRLMQGASDTYTWSPYGLVVRLRDFGWNEVIQPPEGSAKSAGVLLGDRILYVEDLPTSIAISDLSRRAKIVDRLRVDEGKWVRLLVQTGDEPPRDVMVQRRFNDAINHLARAGLTPRGLTYASTLALMLNATILMVGSVLLLRRRREPAAAILSIGLLIYACIAGNQETFWGERGQYWVLPMCSVLGFSTLNWGMLVFPWSRFEPRWSILIALLYPLLLIASLAKFLPGWPANACIFVGIVAMIIRYRRQDVVERRRWKWAMLGFALSVAFATITLLGYSSFLASNPNNSPVDLWMWIVLPVLSVIIFGLFVGGIVLSILRYRLYDTRTAFSNSLIYGILGVALIITFAGSEKLVEIIGEEKLGPVAKVLAAVITATALVPLHHHINTLIQRLLRGDLLRLRSDLLPSLFELSETATPTVVVGTLLEHLEMRLQSVRGVVLDGGRVMASRGIDFAAVHAWNVGQLDAVLRFTVDKRDDVFPLRIPLSSSASRWLLLGPRPDGSLYGKDERDLLAELAAPIGQAIGVASHNSTQAALIEDLRRKVGALAKGRGTKRKPKPAG